MYPVLSNTFRTQRNLIDTLFGDDFFGVEASDVIDDYSVRTNVSTTEEEYFPTTTRTPTRPNEFIIGLSVVSGSCRPTRTLTLSAPTTSRAFCPSSFPAKPLRPVLLILTLSNIHN